MATSARRRIRGRRTSGRTSPDHISGVFWARVPPLLLDDGFDPVRRADRARAALRLPACSRAILGSVVWILDAAWGWSGGGLLTTRFGFHDSIAALVVHGVAGAFTLGVLFNLGPRIGKYTKDGLARTFRAAQPAHDADGADADLHRLLRLLRRLPRHPVHVLPGLGEHLPQPDDARRRSRSRSRSASRAASPAATLRAAATRSGPCRAGSPASSRSRPAPTSTRRRSTTCSRSSAARSPSTRATSSRRSCASTTPSARSRSTASAASSESAPGRALRRRLSDRDQQHRHLARGPALRDDGLPAARLPRAATSRQWILKKAQPAARAARGRARRPRHGRVPDRLLSGVRARRPRSSSMPDGTEVDVGADPARGLPGGDATNGRKPEPAPGAEPRVGQFVVSIVVMIVVVGTLGGWAIRADRRRRPRTARRTTCRGGDTHRHASMGVPEAVTRRRHVIDDCARLLHVGLVDLRDSSAVS